MCAYYVENRKDSYFMKRLTFMLQAILKGVSIKLIETDINDNSEGTLEFQLENT